MSVRFKCEAFRTYEKTNERKGTLYSMEAGEKEDLYCFGAAYL
jgi:hypothetical protein